MDKWDVYQVQLLSWHQTKAYIYSFIYDAQTWLLLMKDESEFVSNPKAKPCVEEHRSIGGSIISRLDNGAFVGLLYELLVFS